jgi:hypothetical protein
MIKNMNTGKKSGNKFMGFILLAFVLLFMVSCAAGPNKMEDSKNQDGKVAGFLPGLWQGFIALFTFIISLFTDNVTIYEIHNNGGWYNFGFILGVMIFFSGSGGAGKKACSRKKE